MLGDDAHATTIPNLKRFKSRRGQSHLHADLRVLGDISAAVVVDHLIGRVRNGLCPAVICVRDPGIEPVDALRQPGRPTGHISDLVPMAACSVNGAGGARRSDVVCADSPHCRSLSQVTSTASAARSTMELPRIEVSTASDSDPNRLPGANIWSGHKCRNPQPVSGDSAIVGRLFLLDLSDDCVVSLNPDGSDRKVIVTECRYPMASRSMSGRDTSTGPTWATPRRTTAPSSEPTSTDGIARRSLARAARSRPSSCSSKRRAEALELPGHVVNWLQAALYREMLYLIQQDVLSVEEADTAVSYGPGLRWGVMGQSLQWHLGGGAGGIKHFMEQLMDPLAAMMKTLGNPQVSPELKQAIADGVMREAAGRSVDELAREENEVIIGLLKLRANGATASLAENEAYRPRATI